MKRPQRARPGGGSLIQQMTPLIDLVFLLLSYFLFTLSLSMLEGVLPSKLALGQNPSEPESEAESPRETMVRLVASGGRVQYFLDDWPVSDFSELSDRLARLPRDTLVIIDATHGVQVAPVVRTYNQCLKIGLSRVAFPVTP